jgi:Peptidase inhibitor family I36
MDQQSLSHRMRRRFPIAAALVIPLMLAVPGVAAARTASSTSPASPATALPSCPASTFCTFQNVDYEGTRWNFAYNSYPHNTWFWIGAGANDQISSFYNNRSWATWVAKNCPADQYHSFYPGGWAIPDLTSYSWLDGSPVNDSFSALALATNNGNPPPGPAHGSC